MIAAYRKWQARRYGLRYEPTTLYEFITGDGRKAVWRHNGRWHAFGNDHGQHACREAAFRKLGDAVRYATLP